MSTRSLNKALIIGNLTRDPEIRYTATGTAVATFGVATNRSWTGADGQRQEDVEFHRIVAWAKLAEICEKLLFKGRKVFIEGRIQTRKWTGNDDQERESTEIVADNMMVLDSRNRDGGSGEDWVGGEEVMDKPAKKEKKSEKKDPKKKASKVKPKKTSEKDDRIDVDDIPF